MKPDFLELVILHCLNHIHSERTIYSILHILKGKKSSQTIQDAHLYQLTPFFKTYPQLERSYLDRVVKKYEELKWLERDSDEFYRLNNKGKQILKQMLKNQPIPIHLNGWKYHLLTTSFWERLSLLVQVSSHLNVHHSKYVPIQRNRDVQRWLKDYLHQIDISRNDLSSFLYDELIRCFNFDQDIDPSIFVIRLTGFQCIGMTPEQAANSLQMEASYYHFHYMSFLHFMLKTVISNREQFPILFSIISTLKHEFSITNSTKRTYEYILQGYSIQSIAKMRRLKHNTIEDHIVELALNISEFDISPYVTDIIQEMVIKAARQVPSRQLKKIRKEAASATYFEIRLVLAKFGDML
ncbi:helix-turn-helix domain-containing protein [Bacillus sp. 03113]|uniref:helix-turn-helix domain-containing protein n=1 Tax=Bacillus sp. 03113 TaxID=2578211 RepID=UPI0011428DA8|nr:helix-turn-helix domain-containing protein [Bacillus sp. 03113]